MKMWNNKKKKEKRVTAGCLCL